MAEGPFHQYEREVQMLFRVADEGMFVILDDRCAIMTRIFPLLYCSAGFGIGDGE